jgi:hypothetical protein
MHEGNDDYDNLIETRSVGRSFKSVLVLASTVILGFESRRGYMSKIIAFP